MVPAGCLTAEPGVGWAPRRWGSPHPASATAGWLRLSPLRHLSPPWWGAGCCAEAEAEAGREVSQDTLSVSGGSAPGTSVPTHPRLEEGPSHCSGTPPHLGTAGVARDRDFRERVNRIPFSWHSLPLCARGLHLCGGAGNVRPLPRLPGRTQPGADLQPVWPRTRQLVLKMRSSLAILGHMLARFDSVFWCTSRAPCPPWAASAPADLRS